MARRNQAADQAARRAALQNNDLTGVTTLVPPINLPEIPHILKVKLLKLRVRAFKIIWGGSKRKDSFFCLGTSNESWLIPYMPPLSFRGKGPPKIARKILERNRPPNNYKASSFLLFHLPIKQLPRSLNPSWPSLSNDVGPTQKRTGRWTSPRCQFLKGINTY